MTRPTTHDHVWDRFRHFVTYINEIEKAGQSNTGNVKSLYEDILPELEGEFLPLALGPLATHRAQYAALLSQSTLRQIGRAFMREFAKVLGYPETEQNAIASRVIEYMVTNSEDLNSRQMTFNTVTAAGGNTGTGKLHRLATDKYGFAIENVAPDAYVVKCTQDQGNTNKHEEVFEFRSGDRDYDLLTITGQGLVSSIRAISARDVAAHLQNPSFTATSGTGATLAFTGWTLSDPEDFEASTTTYKSYIGESTGYSIAFTDNANFYQKPVIVKSSKFDPNVPWFLEFALYRKDSADGTLTTNFGAINRAITVSGQSNSTWTRYTVPATLSDDNWYRQWKEDDWDLKFTLASNTTGDVLIDDIVLYPMQNIAGHWYIMVGGETAFLKDDYFSWTVTDGTRAKIAYWCWRMGWPNFPHQSNGSETITDPTDPT